MPKRTTKRSSTRRSAVRKRGAKSQAGAGPVERVPYLLYSVVCEEVTTEPDGTRSIRRLITEFHYRKQNNSVIPAGERVPAVLLVVADCGVDRPGNLARVCDTVESGAELADAGMGCVVLDAKIVEASAQVVGHGC